MKNIRGILFLITIILTALAIFFWWNDAIKPMDLSDPTPVIFTVNKGEGARSITTRLTSQKLIRSSTGFFLIVKFLGLEQRLQAGDFRINRTMDASTVARTLTHGTLDVWVTTVEGWRKEEVATRLAKSLDIPEREFLEIFREGYIFPDTYLIPKDATAGAIAQIFTDNFTKKTADVTKNMSKSGLTFEEIIILASIVEREGRSEEDRPIIAGILQNRLKEKWPLQVDATLQYALGYQPKEKTWWKKELTDEDKHIDSPYNTYRNPGLPPGPISNPGLSSILSVINSTKTDYWYYLHDANGKVHYAKDLAEHEANIRTYLQ